MLPKLEKSHGYELQFFTNHIGHVMLVTGLLEQLKDSGRVVMLSSEGHRQAPVGGIEFDNLSGDKRYARMRRRFNALLICSWRETQCRTRR
jgi:WW domain-containing oxidoreductase